MYSELSCSGLFAGCCLQNVQTIGEITYIDSCSFLFGGVDIPKKCTLCIEYLQMDTICTITGRKVYDQFLSNECGLDVDTHVFGDRLIDTGNIVYQLLNLFVA